MKLIALLTAAGLVAVVGLKEANHLRRLRAARVSAHPAHQPVDRVG